MIIFALLKIEGSAVLLHAELFFSAKSEMPTKVQMSMSRARRHNFLLALHLQKTRFLDGVTYCDAYYCLHSADNDVTNFLGARVVIAIKVT